MRNILVPRTTESAIGNRVGRKRKWAQDMQARFPRGTFERIEAVLGETEDRTDFVRQAVEHELQLREAASQRVPKPGKPGKLQRAKLLKYDGN
jgi:hypothetical protein